ncbi:MAG TPA: response regulator [Abditibacteriaceae bacterium]|jgi:signal transduction histidine kinase/DNA-binding response OmpR family regulator
MSFLHILLLEDSLLDAELTEAQLLEGGLPCKMVRVEKRDDFLRQLQNETFDLILADYSLPSFDGISALQLARSVRPDTPFIFLSGALGEELAIETLKSGATDYVLKDRRERLVPSIHRAMREAAERVERKRAEEALRFLAEASAVLASSLDYNTTLASVARLTVPRLGDFCIIDVLDSEEHLRQVAVAHVDPKREEEIRALRRRYPFDPTSEHSTARVLRTQQVEIVTQVSPEWLQEVARDPQHEEALRQLDIGSYIIAPLVTHERTLGVISFVRHPPRRAYTNADQAVAEDLARRIAMAVDNARLYRETRDAVRARDEFLATLSHELRTPLNAMLGWTQLLRTGELDEATAVQALEIIERNTRSQAQLIEDLLEVSRIITGNLRLTMGPVELSMVIRAALDTVHPTAEAKSISIEYSHETGAGLISGDAHRLQQVIWNLLSNAIKFTPRGGNVTIRLERSGSYAQVKVIDSGQGISTDFLPHVFERFRQADASSTRRYGGLGLGLAIVRHIVELHGGTMHAESAGEGHGATFIMRLPLMAVQPTESDAEDGSENAAETNTGFRYRADLSEVRVLIVDDQPDARRLVTAVLERCGAEVVSAASVREALNTLDAFDPHVLVSDIGMPGEDGYTLIQNLRRREAGSGRTVPAMALTAYARAEDRQKAMAAGFQEYAVKPIEPARLIALVAQLAGRDTGAVSRPSCSH